MVIFPTKQFWMQLAESLSIQNDLAIRYQMKDDCSPCQQPAVSHNPDGSVEQLGSMKAKIYTNASYSFGHTFMGISSRIAVYH